MDRIKKKDIDRFMQYVEVNLDNGCWEWNGTIRTGYGRFHLNKKNTSAHRTSWEIHKGPIPEGLLVLHKCDNPSCVNPEHLFTGTQRDNVNDMLQKQRNKTLRGSLNPMAKLTESKVEVIRVLYKRGGISYAKLAREFNVSAKLIELVVKRIIWRAV